MPVRCRPSATAPTRRAVTPSPSVSWRASCAEFIPDADISFDPQPTSRYNIAPVLFDNSRIKEELGFEHPPLAERVQDIINEVREAAK